jgi:SynChlorMet cassette radical SAM/SPASM protein ScmF
MLTHDVEMSAPPLHQIYFYLTEGCNLRCRHCWIMTEQEDPPTSASKAVLDVDLYLSILEQARPLGLNAVKLTGGEPFLHPQIQGILETIRDARLRLVVETNGVLVTPELAALMAECHQPFVSVSLDGADRDTHEWVRQVPGSFQAALRGLGYLVQAGLKPQIIFTIMQKNRAQVGAVAWLAQDLGAKSVKFNIIQPSPRGDHMREAGEALPLPEVLELAHWVEENLAPTLDIPVFFSQPPAFNPLKRVFGPHPTRFRCGILGILGVLANGSYALCGIGSHIPELVFGHASRDRLVDVWQDSPVLREIREGLPERLGGICHDCLLKGICMGLCLAQNYYHSRDLWTPYWFCQQAADAGLFPESRVRPAC